MDPNKLYCQANKAIIEELDGRVAALEEGGGGGVDAYTKAETDALLNEKQDVLTAGDGIKIENGVISVDASWETFTLPSSIDDLDFDKYDYLFSTSGNMMLLCQSGIDGILLNRTIGSGVTLDARIGKTSSAWKIFTDGNVLFSQTLTTFNPTVVTTVDGTVITAQNIDTYFTDGKPNAPIIVAGDNYFIACVVPANGAMVQHFGCNSSTTDEFKLSFRKYATSALYAYIKNGTTITSNVQRGFNMEMYFKQQDNIVDTSKVRRRLK